MSQSSEKVLDSFWADTEILDEILSKVDFKLTSGTISPTGSVQIAAAKHHNMGK